MKCPDDEAVKQRARELAERCGCRLKVVHLGTARAQLEIEAERRER